jgi:glyoxylase-like metal-dependent hydrolase (beta-lactamase superfamily II)
MLILIIGLIGCFYGCHDNKKTTQTLPNWCNKQIRPELKKLTEIKTKRKWFKVYNVGSNVYAIIEPYNYQEVISYLILGKEKALLFDTGMGLDSISPLIKELTLLPIVVLNSHTHYDHIGGNYEFSYILAMNTDFTKNNAANGYSHERVKQEVGPDALCLQRLPKTDTANYRIRPFKIAKFIGDGYKIDLGGRKIEVIAAPGHSPDAVALFDEQSGYLWSGDSFYEGPIFLFSDGTDLGAYEKSIEKLALLAPRLQRVFPSHNLPIADPRELIDAYNDFIKIKNGTKEGEANEDKTILFKFAKFSFLIKKDLLIKQN